MPNLSISIPEEIVFYGLWGGACTDYTPAAKNLCCRLLENKGVCPQARNIEQKVTRQCRRMSRVQRSAYRLVVSEKAHLDYPMIAASMAIS